MYEGIQQGWDRARRVGALDIRGREALASLKKGFHALGAVAGKLRDFPSRKDVSMDEDRSAARGQDPSGYAGTGTAGRAHQRTPNERSRPSDGELVAEVLEGARERYSLLIERHQRALFQHARVLGLDRDRAREMVQDAFVKAYEDLDRCSDPDRFGAWIGRILRKRCVEYLHRSTDHTASFPPELPRARAEHLRAALESALASLPAKQREAFFLKHAGGRSYEEMAELTGASVSEMKDRVHRARDALRQRVEPEVVDQVG